LLNEQRQQLEAEKQAQYLQATPEERAILAEKVKAEMTTGEKVSRAVGGFVGGVGGGAAVVVGAAHGVYI